MAENQKQFILYHNPACSKSRGAVKLLEEAGVVFQVVEYLKTPPDAKTLDQLLTSLGLEPQEIARTQEGVFKELGLKEHPPATRKEWIEVLIQNPILIQRPILTDGHRAIIGRPPEHILKLLD